MLERISDLSFQAKAFAALVAIVLAGSAVRSRLKSTRRLPLPPGPPGHWLFGNVIPRAKYEHLVSLIVPNQSNISIKSIATIRRVGQPIWTRDLAAHRP